MSNFADNEQSSAMNIDVLLLQDATLTATLTDILE